jgi:hypothetical protein
VNVATRNEHATRLWLHRQRFRPEQEPAADA